MFNNHITYSLYRITVMPNCVVNVMKIRNVVPRVGIKPAFIAVQASEVTITPPRLPAIRKLPESNGI